MKHQRYAIETKETSGETAKGTNGESGGEKGASVATKPVPDTLVVKGLYVGMPGDDALEACKKLAASSEGLVAVDFRNGIEREKDEATKAKERKNTRKTLKRLRQTVESGRRYVSYEKLSNSNLETAYYLSMAGKSPKRYFTIFAIKPTSAPAFD